MVREEVDSDIGQFVSKRAFDCNSLVTYEEESQSMVWLVFKWCSAMLLLSSPFLVARLC